MEFRKDHITPTRIRIKKIEIDNFKSVRHGEVTFNCGRNTDLKDAEADILGIYGQNGSGKTSVIEAIAILQNVMGGYIIPGRYAESISDGADFSKLTFVFDLQYSGKNNPYSRTVTYSFKIKSVNHWPKKIGNIIAEGPVYYPETVVVFDEVISASGMFDGSIQKKQDILTTTSEKYPIGPVRKIPFYVGDDKDDVLIDLTVNQKTAAEQGRSFIFMDETMELFYQHSGYSEYFQVLMELNSYACWYLFAVDNRNESLFKHMPVNLNSRYGVINLDLLDKDNYISPNQCKYAKKYVESINIILPTLIPDMELVLEDHEQVWRGDLRYRVELLSKRKNTIIPLRDESEGIIKLVSILSLIAAAFNDEIITVAIDELDAGIYEYLLGEILIGLETYGKGQFIFTSHNLRPLEVLKKEELIFTTSNPDNRYIRLKGVGRTNNLRSLYLREILGNTQDEQIYDAAKRQKMIAAFIKAGVGYDEEE